MQYEAVRACFRRACFSSRMTGLFPVHDQAFFGVSSGNSAHANPPQWSVRKYAPPRSLSRMLNIAAVLMVLIEISGQNVIE
jgi:hypothetical protein